MSDIMPLARIRTAPTRDDAVRTFFAVLDAHAGHTADVKRRGEQVYGFETPDRPWFQWAVTGLEYKQSAWVASPLDSLLDNNIQRLVFQLESMPESDFVPTLDLDLYSQDLLPRMFGVTFTHAPGGGAIQHFNLIEELPRDLAKLQGVDATKTESWQEIMERMRFLVEVTDGRVHIACPGMQGPASFGTHLMDQAELLMACLTNPDDVCVIGKVWADIATQIIREMQRIAGSTTIPRPRARFYFPDWVTGVIVDDYTAVITPNRFLEVFAQPYSIMQRRVGPLFLHTCGPITHALDMLTKLPGLASLETVFVRGQTKRTTDIAQAKAVFAGNRIVLGSVQYVLGGAVEDMDNLTAEWLWEISKGGGFMIQDSGPAEKGYALFKKLDLL